MNSIVEFYQDKTNYIEDYTAAVEALTPEMIQATLKKITEQGNILEVVMKPVE
jgi:predicted Zn-dependent peptidase